MKTPKTSTRARSELGALHHLTKELGSKGSVVAVLSGKFVQVSIYIYITIAIDITIMGKL